MRGSHWSVGVLCVFAIGCNRSATTPSASNTLAAPASASMAAVRPPVQMASAAKSIVIVQQGEFLFPLPRTERYRVTLRGTQGFRFDVGLFSGSFPAAQCGEILTACLPGTTVSVLGLWNGMDVTGDVVWRGQTFPTLGLGDNSGVASLQITGQFVAPPQAEAATVTFPFTLTGLVQPTPPQANRVTLTLEGNGIATVHLVWDTTFPPPGTWALRDSLYEFNGAHSHLIDSH